MNRYVIHRIVRTGKRERERKGNERLTVEENCKHVNGQLQGSEHFVCVETHAHKPESL